MGVYSTQNVSSIFQEFAFTSISEQNPQVLSTSSETVPESLIQEASDDWVSWLWWGLVDVGISPTKIPKPKIYKTNPGNGWNWAKHLWAFLLGACQTEFLFESNEFHAEESKGLSGIPVLNIDLLYMGQQYQTEGTAPVLVFIIKNMEPWQLG